VAANHQEKNATVLADRGGAVMILEKDCTAKELHEKITELLANPQKREQMAGALHALVVLDSADRICDIMEQLTTKE
jgi:UDP-N-acetylglucosamine--N-acetylmuramyl-(pentapeptide) pyrophosphoryl-undecaprenol N-acetylglucosamine transferase